MALLSPPRLASDRFAPGTYYTDGTRLLQMLPAVTERGLQAVEDCRSLDIMLVSLIDLESMGLRPVEGSGEANRPGRGPLSLSPVELFPGRAPRIRPAAGPSPFKSIVCGGDASHGGSRRAAIILGSTASAAFHGESLGSVSERVAHRHGVVRLRRRRPRHMP